MRRELFWKAGALALALFAAGWLSVRRPAAQHATPTINGTVGAGEYGTNNSQANGGTTWYMTWDEVNLYVAVTGANTSEGAVIYLDRHAITTGSGTNADGNTAGKEYDNTNFASLPFRADFVTYFKDGYREYRTADGAGGWSAPTAGFGSYASSGGNVRELSIPWSAVTGSGRPAQFNFLVYVTSPGGFVYGELPAQNPEGFIGTSATATHFQRVASTASGASTPPFSLVYAPSRTFVVNSTLDTADASPGDNSCDDGAGNCTLRAAIQEANAVTSYDSVNFNVGGGGLQTIAPASALPGITDPVVIDGYTQPGSSANTLASGNDAVLNVVLSGASAGAGTDGLRITGGTTTVRGLVINLFGGHGINITNADFNVVTGCFIGTDANGALDLGNSQDGIFIQGLVGGSDTNRIGGTAPAERNLISGNNGNGIGGAGGGANTIQGNYVGTDRAGTTDLGNGGNGVVLSGAGSTLGGTTAAARNVISGNDGVAGVNVSGGGHFVQGNYVGTDFSGTLDLGNNGRGILFNVADGVTVGGAAATTGQPPGNLVSGNGQDGIQIGNSSNVTVRGNLIGTDVAGTGAIGNAGDGVHIFAGVAQNNTVGGTAAGEPNVIAFNFEDGVFISDANSLRNAVLSNSIHSNTGLGLDLNPNGVTANDAGDADTGPNLLQNYPAITSVSTSGGSTTVSGTLNSRPNSTYRVEFFSNQACDPSGNGEGQTFLGAKNVTTDGSGNATFASDPLPAVPLSRLVTATATSVANPADAADTNNTSEFSQCAQELAPSAVYVVNTTADTPDANTADGLCLDASGFCSLRAAIEQANANPSADTISFLIPTATDPGCVSQTCTISPTSQLPTVIFPVTINGYTQPLSSENTLATGSNAVLRIVLNGSSAGAGADGLRITAGSSQVRGLVIRSFGGDGIELSAAGGNLVYGNFIGTNSDGTAAGPGNGGSGVNVSGGTSNTVGGDDDDDGLSDGVVRARNVISANGQDGVRVTGTGTTSHLVQGNLVGTDRTGATDLGNTLNGVSLSTNGNQVGGAAGATPGTNAGNVISGNNQNGVLITSAASNLVQGNLIGLQADGATARANSADGVHVTGAGASGNTVGGAAVGFRNVISANTGDGVELNAGVTNTLIASNYIGTDRGGTIDRGNSADGVTTGFGATSTTIGGLTSAPGQAPGNVISGNDSDGVELNGGAATPVNNTVQGNLIGTDRNGVALLRNTSNGVLISSSPNNLVGGATATARNVITGGTTANSDSIDIQGETSDGNTVQGNYIGTDINGGGSNTLTASDFGSGGDGVRVSGGGDNTVIGGSAATPGQAPGNVISGHGSNGVEINGATTGALIQGNLIGTQGDGITAYANGAEGVFIATATGNTVGGLTETPGTGLGNVISANGAEGVELSANADSNNVLGNLIGLAAGGTDPLGNAADGVRLNGARLCTVGGSSSGARNVISANGASGVVLNEGQTGILDNNTVQGNYIGTDITGALDRGNTTEGVRVNGADGVTVGGIAATPGAAPGNVVSGNDTTGVEILETVGDTNTVSVLGNLIGTDATGAAALPNTLDGVGVRAGVVTVTVGGTAAGSANVISANGSDGVEVASGGHTVQGNRIGTDASGAAALGNTAHGVFVSAANTAVITIGGTAAGTGNTIAFNGGDGVYIPSGLATVRRNSIYSNAGLGLDLGSDGVTLNDPLDPDAGANSLQNFPVVVDARTGSTVVTLALNSTPNTTFQVDLYDSASADPTAHGEGQNYLDSLTMTTDAAGNAVATHTAAASVAAGRVVTATATNPSGHTSEFSNTRIVLAPTLARVRELTASALPDGVLVEWRTSFEADNLGFRVWREEGGRRTLVTPSLVAGSALKTGAPLSAGDSYAWLDAEGGAGSVYFVEDVDLNGAETTHGPAWPVAGDATADARRARHAAAPTLEQLGVGRGATHAAPTSFEMPSSSASSSSASSSVARDASAGAQAWLASVPAVKLSVSRAGWYRVTRGQLEAAGLSPSADPASLRLYAEGVEVPMALGADGSVEFYGEGLDTLSTDTRVYWLTESAAGGPPRRVHVAQGAWGAKSAPVSGGRPAASPQSFPQAALLRERTVYFSSLLNGEAGNFFGRAVTQTSAAQSVDVRGLQGGSANASLEVAVQGVTAGAHVVRVLLNGAELGTINFAGRGRGLGTFKLGAGALREGANEVRLISAAAGDVSLTEYVRVSYQRLYRAEGDRLRMTAPGGRTARVSGFTSGDVRVVDVTDPSAPVELGRVGVQPSEDGFAASFTAPPGGVRTLVAFTGASVSQVDEARANAPSSWRAAGRGADFVIITHAQLREAAEQLAARRAAEGLRVEVVDVEDLYDEFSGGAHTPQAVRDFLASAAAQWSPAPRYVLLFGDGSYDPRGHLGRGRHDLVPSKLVDTAQMETASDDWLADFDGDGGADVALGRLPVRTAADASAVVSKIVDHQPAAGEGRVLLVADRRGADGFDFESAAGSLAPLVPAGYETRRIARGVRAAAEVRAEIVAAVNDGATVVNWLGHGSVDVWTGEGLLRGADAAALTNSRLPLFVMMTCLNGYYVDPSVDSLSESLLRSRGGAVAVWASTGMTTPESQVEANRALYGALFADGAAAPRLGDAVRAAKSAAADPDVRRTWVLIGDPTSRIR